MNVCLNKEPIFPSQRLTGGLPPLLLQRSAQSTISGNPHLGCAIAETSLGLHQAPAHSM